MVYTYRKFRRSFFRKLPFGELYWDAATLGATPSLKIGRTTKATGLSGGKITTSAVSPTLQIVRVPKRLRVQDH